MLNVVVTGLVLIFAFLIYFCVEININSKSVLFYTVKWRQYSGEVDYQYTVSCTLHC